MADEKKNDGGPAFPQERKGAFAPADMPKEWQDKLTIVSGQFTGMSMRDWYAGMALQGMFASPETVCIPEEVAKDAYRYADAMLAAREGK